MSDLNLAQYATVKAFMAASATSLNAFAKSGQSVAARIFAACAIERIRMPSASLEKVIDTAFAAIKIDVLTPESVKVYRSNATTALRHLATTKEFPQVESGASEAVILAKVQKLIETYSLRGLVKAAADARAPKVAAKAATRQAEAVAQAEATHQANREAREAAGVAADCTLDVLGLVNAVNAFMTAADAGNDDAARVLDMLHVRLEERRAAAATPVLQLAAA